MTLLEHPYVPELIDQHGRRITYLRVSVTDRCDFRCVYCMSEKMTFLPKKELLTLEETARICRAFVSRGVRKIRITGGEPLVRPNIMSLFENLQPLITDGLLSELTLTTNASQLARYAKALADTGVKRINVSLDTRDPDKFRQITRRGELSRVLAGIDAALDAGLKVKINMVALKGINSNEIEPLMVWAHERNMDLSLIETMPMGDVGNYHVNNYQPLSDVRSDLERRWTLTPTTFNTGGPSRYVDVTETGGKLGFITPLTHNFCDNCNRVRVTCTGQIYMCLGQNDRIDLRTPVRSSKFNLLLNSAIDQAMQQKPKGHDFEISERQTGPSVERHMSVTGG
jgi:cyclic pyranopterin phosphate synthase